MWVLDAFANAPLAPRRLTDHDDVVPGRVRWTRDGASIVYAADGHLRKIPLAAGSSSEIPFTAQLAFTRPRRELPAVRLAEPGEQQPARAFLGLALSPDAKRIAAIALGKLWIIPVGGPARAIAAIPFSARGVAWSPSGEEVAWSGGAWEQEDIFATHVSTGATRQVTALPGREASPSYSPDGRYLAFVHEQEHGTLRVIHAHATVTGERQRANAKPRCRIRILDACCRQITAVESRVGCASAGRRFRSRQADGGDNRALVGRATDDHAFS